MVTKLIYTAENGKSLDLFNNDFFDLINADGLTVANASIATTTTPQIDGDEPQNIQANPRVINMDLQIKSGLDVERAKRAILDVVKIKKRGKLTFVQGTGTEQRMIEILGIVQNVSMPRFTNAVIMQISMYCSNPFWQDVEDVIVEISRVLANHHFAVYFPIGEPVALGVIDRQMEQTYNNDGDVDTGLIITIIATGNVLNPKIYNQNGEFIGVDDTLTNGDKVVINTYKGQKTITKNGVSIFNKISSGSVFLRMETGENVFSIDADAGDEYMYFYVSFKRRFI